MTCGTELSQLNLTPLNRPPWGSQAGWVFDPDSVGALTFLGRKRAKEFLKHMLDYWQERYQDQPLIINPGP